MFNALHQRTKRLDFWDVKLISFGSIAVSFIIARFVPELLDVNPWWWGTLFLLCAMRPFYHFWVKPSAKTNSN